MVLRSLKPCRKNNKWMQKVRPSLLSLTDGSSSTTDTVNQNCVVKVPKRKYDSCWDLGGVYLKVLNKQNIGCPLFPRTWVYICLKSSNYYVQTLDYFIYKTFVLLSVIYSLLCVDLYLSLYVYFFVCPKRHKQIFYNFYRFPKFFKQVPSYYI